jgi:uncharacterized protein (TIGR03437 family)
MKTKITLLVLLFGGCALPSFAQSFDSSGDGKLNGAYYFRQVLYHIADSAGDLDEEMNVQGEITFDGKGSYTFNGNFLDCAANPCPAPKPVTTTGTYVVSASGEGYIQGIQVPAGTNFSISATDFIIGLVSQGGVFIGSTTENGTGYNDLAVAAPIATPAATVATFSGAYALAYIDPTFPGGGDALLTMTADGKGTVGTVNVNSYTGTNTTATTQTLTGVTYSFQNGAGQINFGGTASTTNLIGGTEVLYITPDSKFVFGGSANGFDFFVGVLAGTGNPTNYNQLYYQAGLDLVEQSSGSLLDSYFGSLQPAAAQDCVQPNCFVGHQRVNSPIIYGGSSDFSYYDDFTLNGDGSSDDFTFGQHYLSSQDGTIRVGYGIGPYLSLNVAFQAPAFNGSGVYLSPVGVVNAASSAPFTSFLSPGEFLTLYGSGLGPATASVAGLPFPTKLSGVQVLINQVAAPIYYVSANQISVIVPFGTTSNSIAQIQVVNNGVNSNIVTQFTGLTSAGSFTNSPVGGIGIAAAERPDFSIISESNPAQMGETISVYVAGLGAVTNQPADGTAAPSNPLSTTTSAPAIYLIDHSGNVSPAITPTFAGLAPGYAGLYQVNFTIPASGLVAGDASLEIQGSDSDNYEALLPLGAATPAARVKPADGQPRFQHHPLPAGLRRLAALPR